MEILDLTKPVQTRGGNEVRIYRTLVNAAHDVHGAVACGLDWTLTSWDRDGRFDPPEETDLDLVNVPEKHVRYINLYPDLNNHPSRRLADESAGKDRIACIKIEYELGQFDE